MSQKPVREFGYLCVDDFLRTIADARAVKSALELGLIDRLANHPPCTTAQLHNALRCDATGLGLLLNLLRANQVVDSTDEGITLTPSFRSALAYRDLLEAKLDMALLVAPDFLDRFTLLLQEPARFQREARLFHLFDYGRCLQANRESLRLTRMWMRYTTCLTRYEAQACLKLHDFSSHGHVLDIGGNSGEFMLQLCRAHPRLRSTVFDLPAVCEVGREHVRAFAEGERITFMPGNALTDPLPAGLDLVVFKSMLHDWPEAEARRLLTRASQALVPGGTLLIFERGPLVDARCASFSLLPILLFFRSYRGPAFYQDHLETIGLGSVTVRHIELETPFFLVSARLGDAVE